MEAVGALAAAEALEIDGRPDGEGGDGQTDDQNFWQKDICQVKKSISNGIFT
jgi:hypothetical protein